MEVAANYLTEYRGYSYFIEGRNGPAKMQTGSSPAKAAKGIRKAGGRRALLYRAKKKISTASSVGARIEALEKEQLEQDACWETRIFFPGSERISDLLVRRNATAQELPSLILLWEDLVVRWKQSKMMSSATVPRTAKEKRL